MANYSKFKSGNEVDIKEEKTEQQESELVKNLCYLTVNKYNKFTTLINDMCIKSAEEGNVYMVLNELDLKSINFPINEYNFKTLEVFLREEGLLVVTNLQEKKIEIFWVDSVIKTKATKINEVLTKFPAISDKEVQKLLINEDSTEPSGPKSFSPFKPHAKLPVVGEARLKWTKSEMKKNNYEDLWDEWGMNDAREMSRELEMMTAENNAFKDGSFYNTEIKKEPESSSESSSEPDDSDDKVFDIVVTSEDIKKITSMSHFIKTMIEDSDKTVKHREKERIVYRMYLTILKVEIEDPRKNDKVFKNEIFIEKLIEKLNELMLEGRMNWAVQMIVEFEEIKRNRFSK